MYIPSHFAETRTDVMHDLIRRQPLGTLVTLEQGALNANHVPFELDGEMAPLGVLRAHVPRANPVWREASPETEAMLVFHGPQAYVTPSWYPSKQESGRVVPTWNFIVVHAYGSLRVIDDPDWVRAHLERLADRMEAGREHPWRVSDAPREYTDKLGQALVGIEIPIARLLGKWKLSQNQPAPNRAGVERGLRAVGSDHANAVADGVAALNAGDG